MRENMKGTIAIIVVGFLAFIMAASLVDLTGTGGHGHNYGEVATVNGDAITDRELQIALAQERQRLQAQFGNNLPAEYLSDERLRAPVLQGLVQRNVLIDKALDSKMRVSNSELDKVIVQMPEFQTEGKFDPQLFQQRLLSAQHTPTTYRQLLHDEIVGNQLRSALATTAFVTDKELKQVVALSRQTRDFSWVSLPLSDLPEKMTVSEEELQTHYDANKSGYNTEEKVSVEYIELTISDISKTVDISPEAVQKQYDQEVEQFSSSIEREAAHIMIDGDSDDAEQKIAEVQQKLDAGEDFAALATEYSDDFGTKDTGGNLGITTGDAFPPAFESTLSSLKQGEVSTPVVVDGATHFIKLVSVKEEEAPTFDESKTRIESELKAIEAEQIFIEKLAELKDLSYNAETLAEVAEQLSLSTGKTDLFTRVGGIEPVLADNRVVTAAFSDQVLRENFASEVLELAADRAVVVKLLEHEAVRTLTFDEKKGDITTELKLSKAKEQLAEKAKELQTALESGESLEALAEQNELTLNSEVAITRDGRNVSPELTEHVFSLSRPVNDVAVNSSLYLANNDYALVSLKVVKDANFDEMTDEEKRGARLSLARSSSSEEYRAWQTLLVDQAEIDISGADNSAIN